jgi:hypothetical protein
MNIKQLFPSNNDDIHSHPSSSRLELTCSQSLYLESHLRSDHFGSLSHLTSLSLAYCKLATLPPRSFVGLSALTALSIAAHNADWASALSLDLDYEAFVGLDRVATLGLAHNRILRLPERLLCPLLNLSTLDLRYNGLRDLEDLGLRAASEDPEEAVNAVAECGVALQKLDLRYNTIQALTPGKLFFLVII